MQPVTDEAKPVLTNFRTGAELSTCARSSKEAVSSKQMRLCANIADAMIIKSKSSIVKPRHTKDLTGMTRPRNASSEVKMDKSNLLNPKARRGSSERPELRKEADGSGTRKSNTSSTESSRARLRKGVTDSECEESGSGTEELRRTVPRMDSIKPSCPKLCIEIAKPSEAKSGGSEESSVQVIPNTENGKSNHANPRDSTAEPVSAKSKAEAEKPRHTEDLKSGGELKET